MQSFYNKFNKLKGQGNNPDLFVCVAKYDQEIDRSFGIDYENTENKIQTTNEDIYAGLENTALLTSYLDYYQMILDLGEKKVLADLGAGYCRGSLLIEKLGLSSKILSLEVESNRVAIAKSIVRDKSLIIQEDLLDNNFQLPKVDAFFLYLPTGPVINSLIKKVIDQKVEAIFYIIESHGDLIDNILFYPEVFKQIPCDLVTSLPRHDNKIYKFQSFKSTIKKIDFNNIKIKDIPYLILEDKNFILEIESRIANTDDKTRKWKAKLNGARLLKYNLEMAIELKDSGRILQLETQDKIVGITQEL